MIKICVLSQNSRMEKLIDRDNIQFHTVYCCVNGLSINNNIRIAS